MASFDLMVATFPREVPNKRDRPIVESLPMLDVFALRRQGCLVEGWRGTFESGGGCWPAVRLPGKIKLGEQTISIRPHVHLPMEVFACPECRRDCYRLHFVEGEWRCRTCPPRLKYASQCRNLSIVGYARALYLRRRLRASPVLFSPIPIKPLSARRYWRLASELRAIEARLAGLGADNARVLERRYGSKRRRSRQSNL